MEDKSEYIINRILFRNCVKKRVVRCNIKFDDYESLDLFTKKIDKVAEKRNQVVVFNYGKYPQNTVL